MAEELYHGGSHGGAEQAYVIEVEEDAPAEDVVEVAFADVYASADAGAGERLFRQCSACHRLEQGANGTGPYLYAIVDRAIGAAEGYAYSGALDGHGESWTPENLSHFIENPSEWAPGTKMNYRGMDDVEDRANLIAYLATIGG